MRHGIVRFYGDGLIDLRHRRWVIASRKGIVGRVEELRRPLVGLRLVGVRRRRATTIGCE